MLQKIWNFLGYPTEPEPVVTRKKLSLTPVSEFCARFIVVKDLKDGYDTNIPSNLDYLKKELTKITNQLNQNVQPTLLPQIDFSITFKSKETQDENILIYFKNKIIQKQFEHQNSLYKDAISDMNQMIEFSSMAYNEKYPIFINFSEFTKEIQNRTYNNSKIKTFENRIRILDAKIEFIHKNYKSPSFTSQNLLKELKNFRNNFNPNFKFFPESEFDIYFANYIDYNPSLLQKFNNILDDFTSYNYSQGLDKLTKCINDLCKEIGIPLESDESLMITCCANRYFFDKVAIELPYLLFNDLQAKDFIKRCEFAKKKTVGSLLADMKKIFVPSQINRTILDVFTTDDLLKASVEYLSLIQFKNSPLDIVNQLNESLILINKFVIKSSYINKKCKGDESVEIPEDVYLNFGMVEADDSLTVFYMCFLIDPPPNSVAIGNFLKTFGRFDQFTALDMACVHILAAIKFISTSELINPE